MCPRCKSTQWLTKSEDPDYWNCLYCGENPKAGIITLPYVAHSSQRKHTDTGVLDTCADCGVETSGRGKRCKNCAGKGARV